MKKYIHVLILGLFFFLLSKTSPAQAAVIFSDSFSGGYNTSLWTIFPGQFAPIPSPFGIIVDPLHASDYASLVHSETLPTSVTVKVDMKINTTPPSDMGIFINDVHNLAGGSWKNAYLFGIGFGGIPNSILLRDSNDRTGTTGIWDTSIGIHHIELDISGALNSPITLKEDGNTLLTWNSTTEFSVNEIILSLYGTGSEFANFQLCDSSGCEAITPTPIPTATPSPTPTPTPTPPPKVVMIPGFGGSWNPAALLSCSLDNSGEWTLTPILGEMVYNPLISGLTNAGYTVIPFYYDWRHKVTDDISGLINLIAPIKSLGQKVYMVGHSMGGLVGADYLANTGAENDLLKLLTVGAPHRGTALAYPAWSSGKVSGDPLWKFAATLILKHCGSLYGNDRLTLQALIPSVQNLLPIDPYLRDKKTKILKPISDMVAKNNLFPIPGFTLPFPGVTVGALSGTGYNTIKEFITTKRNKLDELLGNWEDGKPVGNVFDSQGDGTVLVSSSQLPLADNKIIISSHSGLVSSNEGVQAIVDFFNGLWPSAALPLSPQASSPQELSSLVFINYPGHLSVTDPAGHKIKDTRSMVALLNPKKGGYTLQVLPESQKSTLIIGQFLPNDNVLWKEYNIDNQSPKNYKIFFDPDNPREDLLN